MYLSCLALSAALVGNSSSGLLEAPALGIAAINVGGRQEGRERPESVVDVPPDAENIKQALREVCTTSFKAASYSRRKIFDNTRASEEIVDVLRSDFLSSWKQKRFYDLDETRS